MFGLSGRARFVLGVAWILVGLVVIRQWLVDRPSVEILWQTETEFDSVGFNVLRGQSETGPFIKANDRLIPASNDAAAGADYVFVDNSVVSGQLYFYQLEDVDLSGNATQHAPIAFEAPDRAHWLLALGSLLLLIGLILIIAAWARARQR